MYRHKYTHTHVHESSFSIYAYIYIYMFVYIHFSSVLHSTKDSMCIHLLSLFVSHCGKQKWCHHSPLMKSWHLGQMK
jgi:hypothetical protein